MSKKENNLNEEILKVLKDIKTFLEPRPAPPAPPPPKGFWNEFLDFISKYKVLGLAVAFIMGVCGPGRSASC
ncbi:MAG: hypothetical protein QXY54_05570 [Nitrososphaerota archaeon]